MHTPKHHFCRFFCGWVVSHLARSYCAEAPRQSGFPPSTPFFAQPGRKKWIPNILQSVFHVCWFGFLVLSELQVNACGCLWFLKFAGTVYICLVFFNCKSKWRSRKLFRENRNGRKKRALFCHMWVCITTTPLANCFADMCCKNRCSWCLLDARHCQGPFPRSALQLVWSRHEALLYAQVIECLVFTRPATHNCTWHVVCWLHPDIVSRKDRATVYA